MADSDLQREVARLRQELKVWEDRCNKLTKEKELCLKKADQQTLRIQELQSEIEHLQNVVQQVRVSADCTYIFCDGSRKEFFRGGGL